MIAAAIARASTRSLAPRRARASCGQRLDRVDPEAADPRLVEVDVVRRLAELLQVRAQGLGRYAGLAVVRQRGGTLPLRELFPVRAEQQAVVDVLVRLEAERVGKLALELGVRAVVGAADDVRDLEVVVVDHARQVVRGRSVGAEQGRPAIPHGAVVVALADRKGGLAMAVRTVALAGRPLVPRQPEPLEVAEDRVDGAGHLARPVRVVDPEQHPLATAAVGDRGEGAAEVERARRARRKTDSGGHALSLRSPDETTSVCLSQTILRLLSHCS
jgi:hypothetical protein